MVPAPSLELRTRSATPQRHHRSRSLGRIQAPRTDRRRLRHRVLGGFELVGGHGDHPPVGTLCSVVARAEGIIVVAEVGATGHIAIPYRDVLHVETTGRGVIVEQVLTINGQTSSYGAIRAQATARPSRNPAKRTVESFLRITARDSELRLRHWTVPPDTVRDILGRIFVAHAHAAQMPTQPIVVEVPTQRRSPHRSRSALSMNSSASPNFMQRER